jgi:hypothetical protein
VGLFANNSRSPLTLVWSVQAGGGLVFWHPKGGRIRNIIETFWKNIHIEQGYELVYSPHMYPPPHMTCMYPPPQVMNWCTLRISPMWIFGSSRGTLTSMPTACSTRFSLVSSRFSLVIQCYSHTLTSMPTARWTRWMWRATSTKSSQ